MSAGEDFISRPHAGPQEMALRSPADILLFGGAAGGGKTIALLLESVRHVGNPQFGAVIFRRTYPQIFNEGGLWDTSQKIYPLQGGRPREAAAEWIFPSGAKVKFAHMEHEASKRAWDGSQVPLIGWDELTSFSETMFWYMLSRNRTACGIRPYVRATCNPDADSWVANLVAWWIHQDTGFPIPDRSGKLRWFVREAGKIEWSDSAAELAARFPENRPKSLTFIPAKLEDNPTMERRDPGYRANLLALEHVERARLLEGNWKVRPAAGLKFPRNKWNLEHEVAPPNMRLCRFWDRAFTEGGKGARTAGVLIGELPDFKARGLPQYWIVNVRCGRWGDAEREAEIKATAEMDRSLYGHVTIGIEQEGGAGKHSARMTVLNLSGFDAYMEHPTAKKALRWTPLAAQQQVGNVAVVKGDWEWADFVRTLDALSGDEKLDAGKLKDEADAAAGGFKFLTQGNAMFRGELIASGDPTADDRTPLTKEELADAPEFLKELLGSYREDQPERDDDLPFNRRQNMR